MRSKSAWTAKQNQTTSHKELKCSTATKLAKNKNTELNLNSWTCTPDEKRFGLALDFLAKNFESKQKDK